MKIEISSTMTPANIQTVLESLRQAPAEIIHLSSGLTPEQLRQPLGDGERSMTEDLAHLVNSEERFAESIYLALLLPEPLIAPVHSERDWGKLLRHDQLDFAELLAYFQIRRKVLMRVLDSLKEAQWARVIREEGKQRKESVYWRARTMVYHEADHLDGWERKRP